MQVEGSVELQSDLVADDPRYSRRNGQGVAELEQRLGANAQRRGAFDHHSRFGDVPDAHRRRLIIMVEQAGPHQRMTAGGAAIGTVMFGLGWGLFGKFEFHFGKAALNDLSKNSSLLVGGAVDAGFV